MESAKFYLLMKDHWTAKDFAEYDKLMRKPAPKVTAQPKTYKIGDTKIDSYGRTWKKIDENTWECLY